LRFEIVDAKKTPPNDDEIRTIVEIEFHPKVREWLIIDAGQNPEEEFEFYKRFFNNLPEKREAEALLAKHKGRVIGFLVLWRLERYMEHVASIGLSVHPDYWGNGIATQLIEKAISLAKEDGVKRLEIETLSENTGMRRAAEKTGFKYEYTRKNRILKDGLYHDEVCYFMLL